jgi:hypothetical protein
MSERLFCLSGTASEVCEIERALGDKPVLLVKKIRPLCAPMLVVLERSTFVPVLSGENSTNARASNPTPYP